MDTNQLLVDNYKMGLQKFDNNVRSSYVVSFMFVIWAASQTIENTEGISINLMGVVISDAILIFFSLLGLHILLNAYLVLIVDRANGVLSSIDSKDIKNALLLSTSYMNCNRFILLIIISIPWIMILISLKKMWELPYLGGMFFVIPQICFTFLIFIKTKTLNNL